MTEWQNFMLLVVFGLVAGRAFGGLVANSWDIYMFAKAMLRAVKQKWRRK